MINKGKLRDINLEASQILVNGKNVKPLIALKEQGLLIHFTEQQAHLVETMDHSAEIIRTPSLACELTLQYRMHLDTDRLFQTLIFAGAQIAVTGKFGDRTAVFNGAISQWPDFGISGNNVDSQKIVAVGLCTIV